MRLDLFSKDDTVLLLGEGNFSFSVCLHKHQLPIKLVATCFEKECHFENQEENIKYLKSNKVPVFFNVDALKLHENENFPTGKFSKIIFNFPHVGGKMKIHLNRELLKKVFVSCSKTLKENGAVLISLCRGQGGTPMDKPQRRWDDSWQITEMAAHGNFILTSVEPFLFENFTGYRCVGYRGQDAKFYLKGALVHVFHKKEPPFPCLTVSLAVERLSLVPLTQNSFVFVPVIYAELYQNNPLCSGNSPLCFLKRFLVESFRGEWVQVNDDEVPISFENAAGVSCEVDGAKHSLRSSPCQIFSNILKHFVQNKFLLFSGAFFNPLGTDFLGVSPVEFKFVIVGNGLIVRIKSFLDNLVVLFDSSGVKVLHRAVPKQEDNCITELVLENSKEVATAALLYERKDKETDVEIAVINAQTICQYFFQIGWRELWSTKLKMMDNKPILVPVLLYPSNYKFDVTLRYTKPYTEEEFCRVLWVSAGQLIEGVETISEYTLGVEWYSKCHRITYRSLDKPLFRRRVVEIHSKIVSRALELGLNVTVG